MKMLQLAFLHRTNPWRITKQCSYKPCQLTPPISLVETVENRDTHRGLFFFQMPSQDTMFPSVLEEMLPAIPRLLSRWLPLIESPRESKVVLVAVGVVLGFGYLFLLPWLQRRYHQDSPAAAFRAEMGQHGNASTHDWIIICRRCRARNTLGYQYCYNCISPLPDTVVKLQNEAPASAR